MPKGCGEGALNLDRCQMIDPALSGQPSAFSGRYRVLNLLQFFTRPLRINVFVPVRSTALLCLCAIVLGWGWMGCAAADEGIEAARQHPAQGLRGLDLRVDTGEQPPSALPELVVLPELQSAG